MKILLLGRRGQVGWELERALAPLGPIIAASRDGSDSLNVDLGDTEAVTRAVRLARPDVIVNAAAYTAVDRAEEKPELAHAVNAVAPGVLGRAAREHGALLVHYSTDYVFNGSGDRPWTETDVPAPLSVYGESKLRGEQAIRESGCLHLILRTSWVYAARGSNFLRTILRAALKQRTLRVVCDQIGAPTGAELIADVTARILPSAALDSQRCGTYHLAAAGATSWHEYASYVVERARACGWPVLAEASSIEAIPTDAYPTAARRPSNSRLDCQVLTRTFGVHLPDWRCGVDRVLTELRLRETQGP